MERNGAEPNYVGLVRFLIEPFLDSSEQLRVDCETSARGRVLIRLAFEGDDKGRVFGRGGRNIQAVRTVLQAVAQASGKSAHLEVFGSQSGQAHDSGRNPDRNRDRNHDHSRSRPSRRPQPRQ
jgi:uncharacterized protein